MPEFVEVQLMAAVLRVGLVGRRVSTIERHFTPEKKFLVDSERLRGQRVVYVYATGKTVVIVLDGVKARTKSVHVPLSRSEWKRWPDGSRSFTTTEEVHSCLVFQPVQMGFITMVANDLLDKSPLYRGKEWRAATNEPIKGCNVGFVIHVATEEPHLHAPIHVASGEEPDLHVPTSGTWGCPKDFPAETPLEQRLDTLLTKGAY